MKFSMTLLSMILKTKKRLSEDHWYVPIMIVGLVGLTTILFYGMRTASLTWEFGVVKSSIPIMSVDIGMEKHSKTHAKNVSQVLKTTPMIVLADKEFYVGDLNSFTTGFVKIRNKYRVPHIDGSPQMNELLKVIEQRNSNLNIHNNEIAILLPGEQWPMAVIIQVMNILKKNGSFKHVILASELI